MKRLAIRRTIQCLVDYWLTLLTDLYQFTAPSGLENTVFKDFFSFFCFLNFKFCKALSCVYGADSTLEIQLWH